MTIAACYLSPEGVVLGADSASTYSFPSGPHHFNYGQKLFEIGDPGTGTFGIVTWGLGGLSLGSYRTFAAALADDLRANAPSDAGNVANRWVELVWPMYSSSLAPQIARCKELEVKPSFDPSSPDDPTKRTAEEENEFNQLRDTLVAGFCIAGYAPPSRAPAAFEIIFDPLNGKPTPFNLTSPQSFWGVPAMINRLIRGCGGEVREAILGSGKWSGTGPELDAIIARYRLFHPQTVPIREAVDFIHAALLTTIKAMKFSLHPRVCGGPIELAVITTDRPFRWVRHKSWDAAIEETES